MLSSILGSILAPNMSTLATVIQVGEQIPNIVEGVENVVPLAKQAYADFQALWKDVSGGDKYSDIPEDITRLVSDVQAIWTKAGLDPHKTNDAAVASAGLPSINGIAAVKHALGLG